MRRGLYRNGDPDTMPIAFAMIRQQFNLHGLGFSPRIIVTPSGIPGKGPELGLSDSKLRRLKNAMAHKPHQGKRECERRRRQMGQVLTSVGWRGTGLVA